ncbi:ribonuclease H family protein [Streptomyces sp. IBSBF 2390]|uniref:ribonuclease H family protein n=1 Tax=Streptomyces sp. IBSBF 2390 TaxID=2903533 RepID=UPI002FDBE955
MYGALVWWPATSVKRHCRKLDKILRIVGIGISGALRTTPTDSILAILGIHDSHQYAKFVAARAALRLTEIGQWRYRPYGHAKILDVYAIAPKDIDACIGTVDFKKHFSVEFPERSFWESGDPLGSFDSKVFTDGSKTDFGCGAGFHISGTHIRRSFRLPNECTVFQGEIYAVKLAADSILNLHSLGLLDSSTRSIAISVDSQGDLKAMDFLTTSSTLVRDCKISLNQLSSKFTVTLMWVPGHSNVEGNELADLLARQCVMQCEEKILGSILFSEHGGFGAHYSIS